MVVPRAGGLGPGRGCVRHEAGRGGARLQAAAPPVGDGLEAALPAEVEGLLLVLLLARAAPSQVVVLICPLAPAALVLLVPAPADLLAPRPRRVLGGLQLLLGLALGVLLHLVEEVVEDVSPLRPGPGSAPRQLLRLAPAPLLPPVQLLALLRGRGGALCAAAAAVPRGAELGGLLGGEGDGLGLDAEELLPAGRLLGRDGGGGLPLGRAGRALQLAGRSVGHHSGPGPGVRM